MVPAPPGSLNVSHVTPVLPDPSGTNANANGKSVAVETPPADSDVKSNEEAVHLGYYCDGDGCVMKGLESIVGARYECVSCHKDKFLHNLCGACYDTYPFKSVSEDEIMRQQSQPTESTTAAPTEASEFTTFMAAPVNNGIVGKCVEHEFRCVKDCAATEEAEDRKRNHRPISKDSTKAKVAFLRQFDHLNFVLGILVLYPLGLVSYFFNHDFGRWVKMQRGSSVKAKAWLYELMWPYIQYGEYFAQFRFVHIGICLIWNAASVWGITKNLEVNGSAWMWYWIVTWEVLFVQILATQAQLHARRDKIEDIMDSIFYIFRDLVFEVGLGLSFIGHYVVYVLDRAKVSHFCDYQCRLKQIQANAVFWFPLPNFLCKDDRDGNNRMTQRYCRVHMTRSFREVYSSDSGYGPLLATVCCVLCSTLFITIVSSNSRLVVNTLGNVIHLPHVTNYTITDATIVPVCLANSDLEAARLHLSLHLLPVPTVVSGLPTYSMRFNYTNSTLSIALMSSLEQLWYASLVNTTPQSFAFQLQPNHDFVAAIVSIPDVPCSAVSEIQLWPEQSYPESMLGLQHFQRERPSDEPVDTFGHVVVVLIIVVLTVRLLVLFLNTEALWDVWQGFNELSSKNGGVWVPDHKAHLPIDFRLVENCLAWFELRSQLIEITNVNIITTIPYVTVALVQFLVSLVWICWYIVLGRAPIPGFFFLICACASALLMLVILYPLYNIWKIQYSHIALITSKCFDVEATQCYDPVTKEYREQTARVLIQIRNSLEFSDERLQVLGLELSPGFVRTLGTVAVSGISFLLGGKLSYYASDS